MGQSSSTSTSNVTNVTDTFTANIAESFNNALNTTQSFQNIGNVSLPAASGVGESSGVALNINYGVVFALIAAVFGFFFLMKRKA